METNGETLEQLELTVTDVVYGGKGLARLDGLVVFIPGTLAGEKVRVAKLTKHARFAEARAVEILERSSQRVEPVCPLTGTTRSPSESCAGCCYQHTTYAEEIRMKQAQFANLLQRLGKTEPAVCLPAVASPLETGYRNKIVLHPGKVRGGQPVLGYVAEDNKTILDVAACPLAMPALNDLLKNIRGDREFMASLDPDTAVTLRCTPHDGAFHWPKPRGYSGPARLTEVAYFGDIVVSYKSFFQVNPAVGNLVAQAVTGIIAAAGCKVVVDLYGGAGILALAARKAGVLCAYGVDTDNRAIRAARANAARLGIDNVEFHNMSAADGLKKIGQGIKPTHTAVIVDPPRKGLEKEVTEVLLAMKPRRIVYVSCAADTLARDVARLAASGYRVKSAQLFDMFPRTALFESVTELEDTQSTQR